MKILEYENPEVAEAMWWFLGIKENYDAFCSACMENERVSIAEWIFNERLQDFNAYCKVHYRFEIKEAL